MIDDDGPEDHDDDPGLAEQPTVDAGSPRAVRKRRVSLKLARKQADEFWRGVFADPVGRKEMWGILQEAHAFEPQFACGPNGFPQVEATWFKAGEQAFGLRLYQTWMLIDRAGVFLMHDEHDRRFARPKDV